MSVRAGRARRSASESDNGAETRPPNVEPPRVCVDVRDVEMDQEVVQPGRRDRLAEQLERHAVVARRQLELVEIDHRL